MKSKIMTLIAALVFCGSAAYADGKTDSLSKSKDRFVQAKSSLEAMLDGKAPLSYEHAIFLIENAWSGGKMDEQSFKASLERHCSRILHLAASRYAKPGYDHLTLYERTYMSATEREASYNKTLLNWAIFRYITDTTLYVGEESFFHLPYTYSYTDPMGTNDWSHTQVMNLLRTGKGNCFALASLFRIFSERLSSDAWLCTAPGHIYIRHNDETGRPYNIELSNGGSFPGSGTIETITHTTNEAMLNNIALRDLTAKQSVALCLVYLAKGYQHKFGIRSDGFMLTCAEKALDYDSLNLNAMLLQTEVYEERILAKGKSVAALQKDADFKTYQGLISHLFSLGYREMPAEMKNLLIKGWTKDSVTTLFTKKHQPEMSSKNVLPTRYASLSWGLFDEQINTLPVERYGRALFDTKRRKIIGFAKEVKTYNEYDFDPVAFAWQVDPLAHKFPNQSPYSGLNDNPIIYVDPDGQAGTIYIVALAGGISGKELIQTVNEANIALQSMNLSTRVRILPGNPADFKTYNLDGTDAIAVVGKKADVVGFISAFNSRVANNLKDQLAENSPEGSDQGGNIIGLDVNAMKSWAKETNSKFTTTLAFSILHGAGHNADEETKHIENLSAALRWQGGHVATAINGKTYMGEDGSILGWGKEQGVNGLHDLMNNLPLRGQNRNSTFVDQMLKRFGNTSSDNYNQNKTFWKHIENTYHFQPQQGTVPLQGLR